jgi:hypothetical protein
MSIFLLCSLIINNRQTISSNFPASFASFSPRKHTSASAYLFKHIHLSPENSAKFAISKANQLNMFGQSQIVHLATFLALLSPALATVYRVEDRSPQTIKDAGGLMAWDPAGTGSVIDHANKQLGDKDPWVSTTTDKGWAKGKDRSENPISETFANHTSFFCRCHQRHFRSLDLPHQRI